jgi:hypothetical protein
VGADSEVGMGRLFPELKWEFSTIRFKPKSAACLKHLNTRIRLSLAWRVGWMGSSVKGGGSIPIYSLLGLAELVGGTMSLCAWSYRAAPSAKGVNAIFRNIMYTHQ